MRRLSLTFLASLLLLAGGCSWFSHTGKGRLQSVPKPAVSPRTPSTPPPTVPIATGVPDPVFNPILPALEGTARIPICLPARVPPVPGRETYYLNYIVTAKSYTVTLYANRGRPLQPNHAPTDDPKLQLIGRIQGEENPAASVSPLPAGLPVVQKVPVGMAPGIVGHMVYVGQGGPPEWGYLTWPENGWLFAVGASGPGWWIKPNELISQGRYMLREFRNQSLPPAIDQGSLFFSFAEHHPSTIIWRWGPFLYKGEANSWQVAHWVASLVRVGS